MATGFLARERARVERALANLTERKEATELTVVDQHPADYASELADRASSIEEASPSICTRSSRRSSGRRSGVEEGTYGLSVESGRPIEDARAPGRLFSLLMGLIFTYDPNPAVPLLIL